MNNTGTLVVLSAPSGSGKTTIARALLSKHSDFTFSISATTRKKRHNEVDGKDYFFLTTDEFEKKISENAFIEYENIYGDYYGSLKAQVDEALRSGKHIVFDIDVVGALAIKKAYPDDAVLIFVLPPDIPTLKKRLSGRKTEAEEIVNQRMARVPMEMEKQHEFDYVVKNDDLQRAISEVENIIFQSINKQ